MIRRVPARLTESLDGKNWPPLIVLAGRSKPQNAGGVKVKKKTRITLETDQVLVMRQCRSVTAWCSGCAAQTQWVTPEMAAAASGLSLRKVFRQVEGDLLHFRETADGLLLICLNSLPISITTTIKGDRL